MENGKIINSPLSIVKTRRYMLRMPFKSDYTNGNVIIKNSLTLRAAKNGRTEFSYEKICIAVLHKLLGCVE